MTKNFSYFEFLLDKSGTLLNEYLQQKTKDPSPWELSKQLIEKSIAVAGAGANAQGVTESELKIYEGQRIWHPLSLAITIFAHLQWDLDILQNHIPLHLQQILMEELLKDYSIPLIPKPEDFEIDKLDGNIAIRHIIYNRWIIRNITKYEELKERDQLPSNLNNLMKEQKLIQETQIINKVKEYRNLSLDILEKSLSLTKNVPVPYPQPRVVAGTEIKTQTEATDENVAETKPHYEVMKLPQILEKDVSIEPEACVLKISFDIGAYYFSKELYKDAMRVFEKALEIMEKDKTKLSQEVDATKLVGYYRACCVLLNHPIDNRFVSSNLTFRMQECLRKKDYGLVVTILREDNRKQELSIFQRKSIERELCNDVSADQLFYICILNFIRNCLESHVNDGSIYHAINAANEYQLSTFIKECYDCHNQLESDTMKSNLKAGVRFALQYLNYTQMKDLKKVKFSEIFLSEKDYTVKKKIMKREKSREHSRSKPDDELEVASDERISQTVSLRADLVSCYSPEAIKEILFQLHNLPPEQSHAKGFESVIYGKIFDDIEDYLMYDTVLVCVTKAKQLVKLKQPRRALSILNICVETLDSYAIRASQGCSVSRVKNVLHHELLWTELKIPRSEQDHMKNQETMRRCKSCLKYKQQDPPPRPHVYRAIVIYLINCKEFQFLVDADPNLDLAVVDYIQLAYHMASAVCGVKKGHDALKAGANSLWQSVVRILTDDHPDLSGGVQAKISSPTSFASDRARGPAEEEHLWKTKCFLSKDDLISFILEITDEALLPLLLSCFASLLQMSKNNGIDFEIKDSHSYSHIWPTSSDSNVSLDVNTVLEVFRPLCEYCVEQNPRNITCLRMAADVFFVSGDYRKAMECYLELGSITTSYFSRMFPYTVWDEKVYKNMIRCCKEQRFYTQAVVLCQFTDPVDYTNAFECIQKTKCEDGMDIFYDCLWDINILEYLIYAHDKRGEIEKRRLAIKVTGQPELNIRGSPDLIKQSQDVRKTKFLRALSKVYWKL